MATKKNRTTKVYGTVNPLDKRAVESALKVTVKSVKDLFEGLRKSAGMQSDAEHGVVSARLNALTFVMRAAHGGFIKSDDDYGKAATEYAKARMSSPSENTIKQYTSRFTTIGKVASAEGADVNRLLNNALALKTAFDAQRGESARSISMDDALYYACGTIKKKLNANGQIASAKHAAEVDDAMSEKAKDLAEGSGGGEFDMASALARVKALSKSVEDVQAKVNKLKGIPRNVASDLRSVVQFLDNLRGAFEKLNEKE